MKSPNQAQQEDDKWKITSEPQSAGIISIIPNHYAQIVKRSGIKWKFATAASTFAYINFPRLFWRDIFLFKKNVYIKIQTVKQFNFWVTMEFEN